MLERVSQMIKAIIASQEGAVIMIKFLSSIKLAIILITAIVAASIFATLNPGMGQMGEVVFSSIWFRILLLFFALNLLLCTIQGIPIMLKKLFVKIDNRDSSEEYEHKIPVADISNTEIRLRKLLKGYKIQEKNTTDKTTLLAAKGIPSLVAPHLLHISILVILIGAFLGTFGSNADMALSAGLKMSMPERIAKGMEVQLNDFQTIYNEDGSVYNWVSDLTLFVDGEKVASGTTSVNHPFRHDGIVFYQSGYGFYHLIGVSGPGREETFHTIPDDTRFEIGGTPFDIRYFPAGPVIKLYDGYDVIGAKRLERGDKIEFPTGEILEYGKLYSVTKLSIKTDPGVGVAITGFILMMISSAMLWTTRYRTVYATLDKANNRLLVEVICKNKEIKEEIYTELALLKTEEGQQ